MLESAAADGISGATIYDALIARCAMKSKAQAIYTWNLKHFHALGSAVAVRVRQPSDKNRACE
jgi:predicted nucleic acid-binding protein